ncbi:DNA-binding transcriptional regulator, Lrp family [Halogranum amylolyticum]|uniref:DNA-binding transcriptional regulator, Lrp family n=1 Tax=Halogranum amylolyticum TaxID=660520 RepID=A0A1H8PPE6_9EURY|nr:Lrp/AsnC family transcriptional regulator [Halogranum amylolyticum]SEO43909.1 DNA-binding transcriptional regulator, Lrp family [Halogranum amylolyticum]
MPNRELDELDRYIVYRLQQNARSTSAAEIAEDYGVSPSTVRNRIGRLESDGVIQGTHLDIDYELVGYQLFTIIFCTAPIPKREQLAREAMDVPGVVSVRELMTGEENLHVVAVGRDSDDLSRIGRDLSKLGLEIVEEELVHNEYSCPFYWFGQDTTSPGEEQASDSDPNGA